MDGAVYERKEGAVTAWRTKNGKNGPLETGLSRSEKARVELTGSELDSPPDAHWHDSVVNHMQR